MREIPWHPAPTRRRVFRLRVLLTVGALAVLSTGACQAEGGDSLLVDRGTFIDAYVELRVAALRNQGELPEGRREEILRDHGVTDDQLVAFAEGHGAELEFMRDVWNEIEARIESAPPIPPQP